MNPSMTTQERVMLSTSPSTTTPTMNKVLSSSTTMANGIDAKKKRAFLNKFLTKTYHMIDQCDPSIASWSGGGDSFTVIDVTAFEKNVLPSYFNHSKFSSFIRQLNFYGFQKLRSDPDLQVHTSAVRFAHEFFRKDQPELLHKITRATAGAHHNKASSEAGPHTNNQGQDVEALRKQVASLQEHVTKLESQIDERVGDAVRVLNENYLARIKALEATYEIALKKVVQSYTHQQLAASSLLSQGFGQHQTPNLAEFIRKNHAA